MTQSSVKWWQNYATILNLCFWWILSYQFFHIFYLLTSTRRFASDSQCLSIRILPNKKLLVDIFQNIAFEWLTIYYLIDKQSRGRETAMSGRLWFLHKDMRMQLYQNHGARFLTTRTNLLNGNVWTCCDG